MTLPQAHQQIAADLAQRTAQHQAAMASAIASGVFARPNPPLNLLADGDSWFDYPLGGAIPMVDHTDIIAQLPSLCTPQPFILKLAHYGDATTTELGLSRVEKISAAVKNPANGRFDAVLFSGGGNDVVGDPFCIWLNDAASVGNNPAQALNSTRFAAILEVVRASYLDLIELRNDLLGPNAPIFVHAYDFAIPSGQGAFCIGPWLKPALDYCGWTNFTQATQIVHDTLTQFASLMASLEAVPANNVVHVKTQGTLTGGVADWDNELHPKPPGFNLIAKKFQVALSQKFPGRA
jgi:hypothetical protein